MSFSKSWMINRFLKILCYPQQYCKHRFDKKQSFPDAELFIKHLLKDSCAELEALKYQPTAISHSCKWRTTSIDRQTRMATNPDTHQTR
jgi:hypothetical protein